MQQVLQMLLREEVPIRQLGVILETLGDYAARTKDPILADRIRPAPPGPHHLHPLPRQGEPAVRASRSIRRWKTASGPASNTTNGACSSACRRRPCRSHLRADRRGNREARQVGPPADRAGQPADSRGLKLLTAAHLPRLVVLSYNEITRDTQIESAGLIMDAK